MIITLFQSVSKAYTRPEWVVDAEWPVIADFLTTFNQCRAKNDMQLFNLWEFDLNGEPGRRKIYEKGKATENYETIPGTIRRCTENAKGVWGIVLDFDGGTTIERAHESLNGLEFVLYTSFRNSPDTNKFRVVLPFRERVLPDTLRKKQKAISETFQEVDPMSFSLSQSFYLHSGPNTDNAVAIWNRGHFLDIDMFEDEVIKPRTEPVVKTDLNTSADVERVLTALKKHYPNPDYRTWLTITFAVANEVGDGPAVALLQQYWPEQKEGEYRAKITTRSRDRGPTMGTLYYLIRKYEPDFNKGAVYKIDRTIEELKRKLEYVRSKN